MIGYSFFTYYFSLFTFHLFRRFQRCSRNRVPVLKENFATTNLKDLHVFFAITLMKLQIAIIFLLIFSVNLFAQNPATILKRAEKAHGGKKNLAKVNSSIKRGLITRTVDGAEGDIIIQSAKPAFYNEFFVISGFETEAGSNGKSGWRRDSRDGLRTLVGAESRDFQTEVAFRNSLWLEYKRERSKIFYGGTADLVGRTADVVLLTAANGVRQKLFFDRMTNLLVRAEIPADKTIKIFDFGDYRPINGVKEAFRIRYANGDEIYEIKFDQIEHNRQIGAAEFDFPQISGESLPDIPALLQELQANEDRVEEILDSYSYTQKIVNRELGKNGVLKEKDSETIQLSFYKGYRIQRLIEKNGKPLTAEQQKDEDKETEKRVAEIEKKIAREEARGGVPDEESRRVSIAEILRASRLGNPRRERLAGRDVIVFDFEPNPGFDFKNAKSLLKFFGKTAGVIWIDGKQKQVIRIEAFLADNFKVGGGLLFKIREGSTFEMQNQFVNEEIWLPSVQTINLSARAFLFKGLSFNQVRISSNYRKFSTEVKDAKVNEIKDPQ